MKVLVVLACALALASAYKGPEHHAVIGKDGVPIDTAEVQHARAAHLTQLAAAQAQDDGHGHYDVTSHKEYTGPLYHGPEHIPVIGKNGVPVDTVEVQHARSAHLAQLAAAKSHEHSESAVSSHDAGYAGPLYHGPQHIPVLDKHGVPIDTPEVQHAKAAHLAQIASAKTHKYEGTAAVTHIEHTIPKYHGPQHIAVIGKDGVPVDTPDVQHARAAHLATHASEKHY